MDQRAMRKTAMPAIRLLHIITDMPEKPRTHGESMSHKPSTASNHCRDIVNLFLS